MSSPGHYVLGVDAGGTKCEAVFVAPDGEAVGWGRWDIAEVTTPGLGGRSIEAVHAAIRRARGKLPLRHLRIVSAGSGLGRKFILPREYDCSFALATYSESHSVFSLVPDGVAIIVLAGTGSHVAGRNVRGQEMAFDGLGPYLGDWGGAVSIGLQALRAAAMSSWHERHRTSLAPLVPEQCRKLAGDPAGASLVVFIARHPAPWQLAALARLVDQEAERGDAVARQILREAAESAAGIVYDVAVRLGMTASTAPLLGVGSVPTCSRLYWEYLCAAAAAAVPGLRPARVRLPLAACNAFSAFGRCSEIKRAAILERLRVSLVPLLGYQLPVCLEFTPPAAPVAAERCCCLSPRLKGHAPRPAGRPAI